VKVNSGTAVDSSELAPSKHSPAVLQEMADQLLQGVGDRPPVVFYHYPCADGKHVMLPFSLLAAGTC
jgi:hypothetical protein